MVWNVPQLSLPLIMTKSISSQTESQRPSAFGLQRRLREICFNMSASKGNLFSGPWDAPIPWNKPCEYEAGLALDLLFGNSTLASAESSFDYGCCGLPWLFQTWTLVALQTQFFLWGPWSGLLAVFLRTCEKCPECLLRRWSIQTPRAVRLGPRASLPLSHGSPSLLLSFLPRFLISPSW